MMERRRGKSNDPDVVPVPSETRFMRGTAKKLLNSVIETPPEGHEGARWLDIWPVPLVARKSRDRMRLIEMLRKIDEYMILEIDGANPSVWTNSYMGRTFAALQEELERVDAGNWSKVLSPDKWKTGNRRQGFSYANERMRQEAVFAIKFFIPAFGSKSAAEQAIADILKSLGVCASRPTLENWKRKLREENLEIGPLRSRFYSELPEDLKNSKNICDDDADRLCKLLAKVLRPYVGDRETDRLTEKSAKDSGQ